MNILSTTRSTTLLGALLLSGAAQAVPVTFSGTLDQFNAGPFVGNEVFSGSFDLDESVVPTGIGIATYNGIVDNFVLNVGAYTFTGENGRVKQFTGNSGTDFFTILFNNNNNIGSINGSVGSNDIYRFSVDWRGSNLFSDPFVIAQDLTTSDFSYKNITLGFDDGTTNNIGTIDRADEITFGSASVVPVPAAVWLFGSGLLGLISVARRKSK